MKRFAIALLFSLGALGAHASTWSTDASDLWWNPNESGWGVNLVQQNEVVFATLYTYDASSQPVWYVGPLSYVNTDAQGALNYTGTWYRMTGPWFGGAFTPATPVAVGSATFSMKTVSTGTFSYTVNNVPVSKNIERQTWRVNDVSGNYLGAMVGTNSNCSDPTHNGYSEEYATYTITQSSDGSSITMVQTGEGYTCTFTGRYNQYGRMGEVTGGTVSCSDGVTGTFTAHEVEANLAGITAHIVARTSVCNYVGHFGGLSRTP